MDILRPSWVSHDRLSRCASSIASKIARLDPQITQNALELSQLRSKHAEQMRARAILTRSIDRTVQDLQSCLAEKEELQKQLVEEARDVQKQLWQIEQEIAVLENSARLLEDQGKAAQTEISASQSRIEHAVQQGRTQEGELSLLQKSHDKVACLLECNRQTTFETLFWDHDALNEIVFRELGFVEIERELEDFVATEGDAESARRIHVCLPWRLCNAWMTELMELTTMFAGACSVSLVICASFSLEMTDLAGLNIPNVLDGMFCTLETVKHSIKECCDVVHALRFNDRQSSTSQHGIQVVLTDATWTFFRESSASAEAELLTIRRRPEVIPELLTYGSPLFRLWSRHKVLILKLSLSARLELIQSIVESVRSYSCSANVVGRSFVAFVEYGPVVVLRLVEWVSSIQSACTMCAGFNETWGVQKVVEIVQNLVYPAVLEQSSLRVHTVVAPLELALCKDSAAILKLRESLQAFCRTMHLSSTFFVVSSCPFVLHERQNVLEVLDRFRTRQNDISLQVAKIIVDCTSLSSPCNDTLPSEIRAKKRPGFSSSLRVASSAKDELVSFFERQLWRSVSSNDLKNAHKSLESLTLLGWDLKKSGGPPSLSGRVSREYPVLSDDGSPVVGDGGGGDDDHDHDDGDDGDDAYFRGSSSHDAAGSDNDVDSLRSSYSAGSDISSHGSAV
eukprot:ANDGO_01640.mRNA.1 hypothetical protein